MNGHSNNTFAFVIHPISIKKDVARKYPFLGRILTEPQINFFSQFFPPLYISKITGVVSAETQREATGWFVAAPYTPPTMMRLPVERVYRKLAATGRLAEKLGAKIMGLGAFTSVVGDSGVTIATRLDIPVTTGDSYTVYIAVDALREAAGMMGLELSQSKAAVVGATGKIGGAGAAMLADHVAELILIGRRDDALQDVRERCENHLARVYTSTSIAAMYDADLILTVTSAVDSVIEAQHIKPGAVLCDVARPPDVSERVYREREDVLVIDGGMVDVPGPVDFHFDFGFPPGKAFACMAETMVLALEGRYESYSLGKHIPLERVYEIGELATRHGFKLSRFHSSEEPITEERLAQVREKAAHNRRVWAGEIATLQ